MELGIQAFFCKHVPSFSNTCLWTVLVAQIFPQLPSSYYLGLSSKFSSTERSFPIYPNQQPLPVTIRAPVYFLLTRCHSLDLICVFLLLFVPMLAVFLSYQNINFKKAKIMFVLLTSFQSHPQSWTQNVPHQVFVSCK